MTEIQIAKQTIQALVNHLGIVEVVYVDDYFDAHFDVEVIVGWLYDLPSEVHSQVEGIIPEISLNLDPDIWTRQLRDLWKSWPVEKQEEVTLKTSELLGMRFYQDYQVSTRLKEYFPRKISPKTLSPSEWFAQKEEILSKASPQSKILCIFDQDLSDADGFSETGTNSGIGFIQEIIRMNLQEAVICCLLTHTISSIDDEMGAWRTIAQNSELELFQFLPLAKIRLSNGEKPLLFADGIKKATLNLYCERWKQASVNVIRGCTEKAITQVLNVDVYDFDHMIFQSSLQEGIWETEMLIRLFQIFHRDELRYSFLSVEQSSELHKITSISRPISSLIIDHQVQHKLLQIRPIRVKELYEPVALVQHTALEVGDIFIKTDNQAYYILLSQQCDLMVRSSGGYAGKRANNHLRILLVPLRRLTQEEASKKPQHHWKTHAVLNYFYPDSSDVAEVCFSTAEMVEADILDLAVLDPDGNCLLNFNRTLEIPNKVTLGWRIRLQGLISNFSTEKEKLEKLEKFISQIDDQETKGFLTQSSLESKCYSKGIFDFKLKRVGRYRQPGSDRLLKAFTNYLSRDADDLDFAKDVS